uniref:Uncharacterized protein n=1 Tax=Rhizophora mucronata TaxID=61149 RepID=A0A2P2LHP5_RHIMU
MQEAEKGDAKVQKDVKESKDENRDEDQDSVAKETKEEKEKVEGEMILVKDKQLHDEAAQEHNSGELEKVDMTCDEENKKEVEVQDKEKHDRSVSETEGVIKDKEALNDNDTKPDQTGTGKPNEKVEGEVVENGSSGGDPSNVNP